MKTTLDEERINMGKCWIHFVQMRSEESEGDIELLNCLFSKVYEYQDDSSGFTGPTLEEQTCGRVKKNTSAAWLQDQNA